MKTDFAKTNVILIIIGTILFSIFAFLYWLLPDPGPSVPVQAMYLVFPVLSTVAGLWMVSTYGLRNVNGKAFLFVSLGYLAWTVGEFIWFINKNLLQIDPYPSLADLFYTLGYPLLFVGIMWEFFSMRESWTRVKRSSIIQYGSFLGILIVLVIYFGIYKAYDPAATFQENFFALTYGVGDLFLTAASIFTLALNTVYRGGRLGTFWRLISYGFISFLLGDVLFAMFRDPYINDMKPAIFLDLFYVAGYLIFAYGMAENTMLIKAIHGHIKNIVSSGKK